MTPEDKEKIEKKTERCPICGAFFSRGSYATNTTKPVAWCIVCKSWFVKEDNKWKQIEAEERVKYYKRPIRIA